MATNPGAQLRAEIAASPMSQRKIADTLGVSAQAVTNWTTGRSRPSWDHLVHLEEILEVEPRGRLTGAFGYASLDGDMPPMSIRSAIRHHPDLSPEDKRALLTVLRRFLPDEG